MFTTTRTEVRETFEPIPAALRSEVREELAYTAGWRRGFAWGLPAGLALMLAGLIALSTLTGCAAIEFREENGPLGPASMKVTPPALLHRSTKVRRTEASTTSPATDESECEGGVCAVPGSK